MILAYCVSADPSLENPACMFKSWKVMAFLIAPSADTYTLFMDMKINRYSLTEIQMSFVHG